MSLVDLNTAQFCSLECFFCWIRVWETTRNNAQFVAGFFDFMKEKTKLAKKGITLVNHNSNIRTMVFKKLQFIIVNYFFGFAHITNQTDIL